MQNKSETRNISIIIPCHNASKHITGTILKLKSFLETIDACGEILLIENGSTDSTLEEIRNVTSIRFSKFQIIVLKSKPGLGEALRLGVARASSEYIIFMADDLPFEFQEIEETILHWHESGYFILSKYFKTTISARSNFRNVVGAVFALLREIILRTNIRDSQGSFFGSRKEMKRIFSNCDESGFLITTEAAYITRKLGIKLVEIPVRQIFESDRGKSTITLKDVVSMFIGLLRIRHRKMVQNIW